MHDELDIHEPEHDHLLDHEFYESDPDHQDEVDPLFDPQDDEPVDALMKLIGTKVSIPWTTCRSGASR